MYARVRIRDNEACKRLYKGLAHVTDNMIFAGGYEDACPGDSGGPLTCWEGDEQYLCGIVSFGTDCNHPANKNYAGVYTDVKKYGSCISDKLKSWIRGKINTDFFLHFI